MFCETLFPRKLLIFTLEKVCPRVMRSSSLPNKTPRIHIVIHTQTKRISILEATEVFRGVRPRQTVKCLIGQLKTLSHYAVIITALGRGQLMKKMYLATAIVSTLVALSTSAVGSTKYVRMSQVTTADLADMCKSTIVIEVRLDPCTSYILGAVDAFQLSGKLCVDSATSYSIVALATVRKYLYDHPEEWGSHPTFVIQSALSSKFVCKN